MNTVQELALRATVVALSAIPVIYLAKEVFFK